MFLNSSNVPTNVETACVNLILMPPTKYASNTQLNEGFSHIFLFLLLSVPSVRVVLQLVISTGTVFPKGISKRVRLRLEREHLSSI